MDNQTIAQKLNKYSSILYDAHADYYRVRAYRWAAERIRSLDRSLEEILENEGRAGIEALPGVGPHLARTIEHLIRTGEFRTWREQHELSAIPRRG